MKIYTKAGDTGQSALFGGKRISKDHIRLHAYGSLDELNSWLGVVLSKKSLSTSLRHELSGVQSDLFQLGAELASPNKPPRDMRLLEESQIKKIEIAIDQYSEQLPPLKNFILPGGSETGAFLHLVRTVCRRAERLLVRVNDQENNIRGELIRYLNRLGDYLFVIARWENTQHGATEEEWKSPGN